MKIIKKSKKKKGFTLIELLAIIVILAIIMVVAIPTVLGSLKDAKERTFKNSVNTVAEWMEKQYGLAIIGDEKVSQEFVNLCGNDGKNCVNTLNAIKDSLLKEAGVVPENYSSTTSLFKFDSKGKICIVLEASNTGDFGFLNEPGDYYQVANIPNCF